MIPSILNLPIAFSLLFGQEQLPPPQEVPPGGIPLVTFELTDSGYKMILNRPAAESLRDAVEGIEDEEELADTIRKKKLFDADEESRAETELIARVVANELPKLKKELRDKMGPNGVTITVIGVEQKPERERPVLKRLKNRLPEVVAERVEKMVKIARFQPLFWSIEPRE